MITTLTFYCQFYIVTWSD